MANIKSSKKRVLINQKKALANRAIRSRLRTVIKKTIVSIENNDASAQEALRTAYKTIDQAVSKNVIHKNTAARRKAKLAKLYNKYNAVAQ